MRNALAGKAPPTRNPAIPTATGTARRLLGIAKMRFGRRPALASWILVAACGTSDSSRTDLGPQSPRDPNPDASTPPPSRPLEEAGADSEAGPPECKPSAGTWSSLVPGPGQTGFDAALAANIARYDRFHEAVITRATGLAGSVSVSTDPELRQKVDHLLATPWDPDDTDPTDDLSQYEGVDPMTFVRSWGFSTGMYAGVEMAADAYRYGVLRDRGGSCTDVARARKMIEIALDAFHVVVTIPGAPGSIARAIARTDLPGDAATVTKVPLKDGAGRPLPATKDNGTWRADNSTGKAFPNYAWVDSCSRDMLFGWTLGIAAIWEVIKSDPTFSEAAKSRLQSEAKVVLDGLRVVRPGGKDLEIWDPDGRRTFHGNLHETSVDRQYIIKNGVASLMALGEVAGLAYVADDVTSKQYLQSLVGTRDLPSAIQQTLSVVALGGESTNYSTYNMLFMTAWMANRYVADAGTRNALRSPVVQNLYAPLFGQRPIDWKQSFFDFVVAASSGGAWASGNAKNADAGAVTRGVETLKGFPQAPFYSLGRINCDAAEVQSGRCTLVDNATIVEVHTSDGEVVADRALPMHLRPPSNYYWRSNPFAVNGSGSDTGVFPGSDLRIAYWMGRYIRVDP